MWIYHTCKHSSQARKLPLEITLRTLWFRNYPLITFCTRFWQLVLPIPVMFLWSCIFMSCHLVLHFQVLHFQVFHLFWSYIFKSCIFSPPVTFLRLLFSIWCQIIVVDSSLEVAQKVARSQSQITRCYLLPYGAPKKTCCRNILIPLVNVKLYVPRKVKVFLQHVFSGAQPRSYFA